MDSPPGRLMRFSTAGRVAVPALRVVALMRDIGAVLAFAVPFRHGSVLAPLGGLFGGTIAGHQQARASTPGHKTAARIHRLPPDGLVICLSGVHGKERVYGSIP